MRKTIIIDKPFMFLILSLRFDLKSKKLLLIRYNVIEKALA